MFTGLIEDVGKLVRVQRQTGSFQLIVETQELATEEIRIGDSVAVNGVCLTVVAIVPGQLTFDVSPETLAKTTLGQLKPRSPVNLERALSLSDRLGGHLVYGHVDAVAVLDSKNADLNSVRMGFKLASAVNRYLVAKGSVAVDGISLTVNTVGDTHFSIVVIPHSLDKTTLKSLKIGEAVNIEVDIFAKYVERLLSLNPQDRGKTALDAHFLAKHGFM